MFFFFQQFFFWLFQSLMPRLLPAPLMEDLLALINVNKLLCQIHCPTGQLLLFLSLPTVRTTPPICVAEEHLLLLATTVPLVLSWRFSTPPLMILLVLLTIKKLFVLFSSLPVTLQIPLTQPTLL